MKVELQRFFGILGRVEMIRGVQEVEARGRWAWVGENAIGVESLSNTQTQGSLESLRRFEYGRGKHSL